MELAVGAFVALVAFALGFFGGRRTAPAAVPMADPLADAREAELSRARERILELERSGARLEAERVAVEARLAESLADTTQKQTELKLQFENLAHKILQKSTDTFRETGERNLQTLLNPLKEKLQEFEKKVETTYANESRERFALKEEIKRISELNQQMSLETQNLTNALKSDVKVQGSWGEFILERLLQRSGLREGEEYITQGEGLKLKTETGEHQKPDVILNLPDGKHLIIDSKVSLKSFEVFANAESDVERESARKAFLTSIYKHVDGLGAKHYSALEGLRTPDFVLLFMPLEPAFSLALQSDAELVEYAWNRRIAFVSPTTLLVTLGTVASIWKSERQNRHALEIAAQGGALYDKFVAFTEDLEKVGRTIADSQNAYTEAFKKLRDGRGNLMARAETLRKLGVKATKVLPERLAPNEDLPQ